MAKTGWHRLHLAGRVLICAGAVAAAGLVAPASAVAQGCPASAYTLSLRALGAPPAAELEIQVSTQVQGCAVPDTFVAVHASALIGERPVGPAVDVQNVPAPGGKATVAIGAARRGQTVEAVVELSADATVAGRTRVLARPNLAVLSVRAAPQVLAGRLLPVVVTVGERNGDVGGSAAVTASAGGVVLATGQVELAPGASAAVSLPFTLTQAGTAAVRISIVQAPGEGTLGDNQATATVEVTDSEIVPGALGPPLAGFGGQFNDRVYCKYSRDVGVTDQNVTTMERSVIALRPQFSRIFFTFVALTDPDLMQSFVRTVLFAQRTGTTINVTWSGGPLSLAKGTTQKFGAVLNDLVMKYHVSNLRWVTLHNEPNPSDVALDQYEREYRELEPFILNIRGQVRFMGGDLVLDGQKPWFTYMAAHMSDILDAYSVHIYWDFWDTPKLESRLTGVRAIIDSLPEAAQKPVYITEFGVRGRRVFNGAPAGDPGVWEDGTPIAETNVLAFQHAWFDMMSARLGFLGTSKWDLYFGKYGPGSGVQTYYLIGGPKAGWPHHPLFNLMYLLTHTITPGWRTARVDTAGETTRLVTAFTGNGGRWTVIGLDRAGGQLNVVSSQTVTYSIGGLPPDTVFRFVPWNVGGDGLDGPVAPIRSDAAGVVALAIPQHAAFALTSIAGRIVPRNESRLDETQSPDSGPQWSN